MPLVTTRASVAYGAGFGKVLSAGGAVDTGVMFPLGMVQGTGSSGVITFSSIPATYTHLQIRIIGFQATPNDVFVKVNSDAGVRGHYLQGDGATAAASSQTGTGDGQYLGTAGFQTTNPTVWVLDLLDYASTTKTKVLRGLGGYDSNGSGRVQLFSALYTTTSAITSITFTSGNSYSTNSNFALYGIKGA